MKKLSQVVFCQAIIVVAVFFFYIPANAILITPTTDASTLVSTLVGSGITTQNESYTGVTNQSGTFTQGNASSIGFNTGVVLTSGNVNQIDGANSNGGATETRGGGGPGDDDISTNLGTSGDTDLDTLSGGTTYDAAVLTFDFQFGDGTSDGNDLFVNFVFASEEYVDYIGTAYNDVFGFFVDGTNIALVPGTSNPVTINNINDATNSAYYRNNISNTDGIPVLGALNHFDGLTTVITAQSLGLGSGWHTMKFAVADTADGILDAGVFIQAGSFNPEAIDIDPVPEPATMLLLGTGLVGIAGAARRRKKNQA